jgi:hypothetical protein
MNPDLVKVLVALAITLACAWIVIAGSRGIEPSGPREKRPKRRARAHPPEVSGASAVATIVAEAVADPSAPSAAATAPAHADEDTAPIARTTVVDSRPRIFTGEPAASERGAPAARRALKLVAGITVLAAGSAIGLLAVVKALVSMVQKIGG